MPSQYLHRKSSQILQQHKEITDFTKFYTNFEQYGKEKMRANDSLPKDFYKHSILTNRKTDTHFIRGVNEQGLANVCHNKNIYIYLPYNLKPLIL